MSAGVPLGVLAVVSWPLALMGLAYVVLVSLFFAVVYQRPTMSRRGEAAVWAGPWLVAVALWTWTGHGIEGGTSSWPLTVWFGLAIATPCYLVWQALSLAVRQALFRA